MNRTLLTLAAAAAVLTGCRSEQPVAGDDITVACYYFPNYHTGDPLNELNKGEGWSEWKLVREAQPRFEGHDLPKVPLWGYTDEKDPAVMARKIEAAASHGIDVMLFDWYRYDSVPFLNRCLDEGFLKAPNVNDIRFGLMWANHDWVEIHPATHGEPQKLLYPGKVSPEAFETIGDELVRDYFTRPNYWLIDGKAYFSVYDVQKFVESFRLARGHESGHGPAPRESRRRRAERSPLESGRLGQSDPSGRKGAGQYARTAARAGLRLGHILRMDTPLLARRHLYGLQLGCATPIWPIGTRRKPSTAYPTTRT